MAPTDKRTISLPNEQAHYIDALVSSGKYASASEVVRAGLRALQERDAIVTQWLKDEVVSAYDAMQVDPSRGVSVDKVLKNIQRHHARRVKRA